MQFERLTFGSIRIDGKDYAYDVVIDRGSIRKRKLGVGPCDPECFQVSFIRTGMRNRSDTFVLVILGETDPDKGVTAILSHDSAHLLKQGRLVKRM